MSGQLFDIEPQARLYQCTHSACGCGRWFEDMLPSTLAPECRARLNREREADDAERRRPKPTTRSVDAAYRQLAVEASVWDAFHGRMALERRDLTSYREAP